MNHLFRTLTWFVLFSFSQTLIPSAVWASSPWTNKHRQSNQIENIADPIVEEPAQLPLEKKENQDLSKNGTTPQDRPNSTSNVPSENLKSPDLKQKISNKFQLPIAAVLEVYSDTLSYAELKEISNSLRREIKNTGRFLVYSKSEMRKAMSKNLDQEIAAAKQIDEYVSQAKKLYDDFKFDSAAAIMKEAMSAIGAFDATPPVAQKISDAYLTQALIFEAQEKPKEADVAFLNAAALAPNRQLEPALFAPSVIAKFYKAKAEFSKIKEGALRLETDPPVAKIIVAEKERGSTPATLKNLPLGVQKITFLKDGFDPWEKNIMIVANSENSYLNKISVNLNRQGESTSLDPLLGELVHTKEYEMQVNKMADIGKLLFSDQVFAARIEKGNKIYNLYLVQIDTHTGREVARGYAQVDPHLADVDVGFAHALADMQASKPVTEWPTRIAVEGKGGYYLASFEKHKPFYKKWLFLTLMSVLVAGGAAGAAVIFTRPAAAVGTVQ